MKRRILLIFSVVLILAGIFLLMRTVAATLTPKGKGALQIISNVKGSAFLNNKPLGNVPLCKCDPNETIKEGEYELKIIPEDKNLSPFTTKIKINPNVLTAVERTFLPGSLASFYTLTLEKTSAGNPEMFVASIPDGAIVSIDGDSKGVTPLTIKDLTASEHELEIQKDGFTKKTVRVRAVPSYRLVLNTFLGAQSPDQSDLTPTPNLSVTPTSSPSKVSVEIKDTPTGFLRVRQDPSTGAAEIGRVKPGEKYPFVDENTDWIEIELNSSSKGWVNKSYAEKVTE